MPPAPDLSTMTLAEVAKALTEQRLPPVTQFHDNIFQRKDWLLKGNTIVGANNLNVTNTTWGSSLVHTTLDDNAMVQSIVVGNLKTRMAVR